MDAQDVSLSELEKAADTMMVRIYLFGSITTMVRIIWTCMYWSYSLHRLQSVMGKGKLPNNYS